MGRHAQNRKPDKVDNHCATFSLLIQWYGHAIIKNSSSLKENWEHPENVIEEAARSVSCLDEGKSKRTQQNLRTLQSASLSSSHLNRRCQGDTN